MSYSGFPPELFEALSCPADNGALRLQKSVFRAGRVWSGCLVCEKCTFVSEIRDGIVHFLPRDNGLPELLLAEISSRNNEASAYDRRLKNRFEKEIVTTLKEIGSCKGKKLIEYGCGTGRITTLLASSCEVLLAVDFSLESLRLLGEKLSPDENVGLVLADASTLKTKCEWFDCAVAIQFFEHLPTLERREVFLENARQTLYTKGEMILTAYHHDLRRRWRNSHREGKHKNGIFYKYFSLKDIQKEFGAFFTIQRIRPIDIHLPFEAKLGLSSGVGGVLSRLCEKIPFINLLGHLILVSGSPKKSTGKNRGVFYTLPGIFFTKCRGWFLSPKDVAGCDAVTFFSYEDTEVAGFKKKKGITTMVDLSPDEDMIWAKMRKNFVCKQIQKGERNGISIKRDENFSGFEKIYSDFRRGKNIQKENIKIFQKHGILFSAYRNEELIGGGVFVSDGFFVRAWALASVRLGEKDGKMREAVGQANRMILWDSMRYFKSQGCRFFDLGGINPDSSAQEDVSLAEFKESFGGTRIDSFYYTKISSRLLRWIARCRNEYARRKQKLLKK